MDKRNFTLIQGGRIEAATGRDHAQVELAVTHAIRTGYRVGQPVRIGRVAGRVVGYNIGAHGLFRGARYPVLVETELGFIKCSEQELAAA